LKQALTINFQRNKRSALECKTVYRSSTRGAGAGQGDNAPGQQFSGGGTFGEKKE